MHGHAPTSQAALTPEGNLWEIKTRTTSGRILFIGEEEEEGGGGGGGGGGGEGSDL